MSKLVNSRIDDISDAAFTRLRVIASFFIIVFSILIIRLWYLQVIKGDYYRLLAENNRIRVIDITSPRGLIYDRKQNILVKNRMALTLTVLPRGLSNKRLIKRLSVLLKMPVKEIKKRLTSKRLNPLKPKVIKRDISPQLAAYIKERQELFPDVEISSEPIRDYPDKNLAAHVLGYLGEISEAEIKKKEYKDYKLGDLIGKSGIEKEYENLLRGNKGVEYIEVNAANKPIRIIKREEPDPGNNLVLTLDKGIQEAAETGLKQAVERAKKGKFKNAAAGAVVVLDPRNGEVLAMVSYPTYNPEIFNGGVSQKQWQELNKKENNYPLNNRAVTSSYPPGSTFKVVTALAGLADKIVSPRTVFYCGGRWNGWGGRWTKWGWKKSGHGRVNLLRAITESCDVYFYELSYRLYKSGNERLQHWARSLGLGRPTGIDLPGEAAGRVPDKRWKRAFNKSWPENQEWFPGDTVNMAIGQGDVLLTPLQLADLYAAVINNGGSYKPHMVKRVLAANGKVVADIKPKEQPRVDLPPTYFNTIKEGLKKVTTAPAGTAYGVFAGFPVPTAGKTGTAEVAGKDDFALFVAYAPVDNPQYVIAVVVEQGGHGGSTAAPVARDILTRIYNVNTTAKKTAADYSR